MSYLRATDVTKWYGDLEVLRGVTFEVGRGEVKVIIGPSGSGKSTLLRCLALLEEPDAGQVSLEGRRPGRGEVGMVFQRFNLFQNMTALGNLMVALRDVRRLPKREARERALEFLERVGLAAKADNYPEELSGGQQQRVAIARALVMRPKAMLFDEPTSALDVELVRSIRALSQPTHSFDEPVAGRRGLVGLAPAWVITFVALLGSSPAPRLPVWSAAAWIASSSAALLGAIVTEALVRGASASGGRPLAWYWTYGLAALLPAWLIAILGNVVR